MEVYKTRCDLCRSEFNTTTALLKHREARHSLILTHLQWPEDSGSSTRKKERKHASKLQTMVIVYALRA